MFKLHYRKNDNKGLFSSLEGLGITKPQNYIPLYQSFFSLDQGNFDSINLNQHYRVASAAAAGPRNRFICSLEGNGGKLRRPAFFKFSPLLDPVKFLVGKYKDLTQESIECLPRLGEEAGHPKIYDPNNAAYVDGFFSYLTSQLLHQHRFIHGLDFYGSFLGLKKDFGTNVGDDLDYLRESRFFHNNRGKLFSMSDMTEDLLSLADTRRQREKLSIGPAVDAPAPLPVDKLGLETVLVSDPSGCGNSERSLVFEFDIARGQTQKTGSTCSSRSSNSSSDEHSDTDEGDVDGGSAAADRQSCGSIGGGTGSLGSCSSFDSDFSLEATIHSFPVHIICLESLDNTLDSLLEEEKEMDDDEWRSCLFQIVMMLTAYQRSFDMTHNDLHTNNIMFNKTDRKFLIYRYSGKYYKVPTYGRIFKIIDFGRAIYRFRGKRICSDSYHAKGDAATQYNCEPYFNENKPRLEPNRSFDLCRLACSLLDYFGDEELSGNKSSGPPDPIASLIKTWCMDDKGRNVLYKKDGEERYPDFKLYKMIARTVSRHIPAEQITHPLFAKFVSSKKKLGRKARIMDVEALPVYTGLE